MDARLENDRRRIVLAGHQLHGAVLVAYGQAFRRRGDRTVGAVVPFDAGDLCRRDALADAEDLKWTLKRRKREE